MGSSSASLAEAQRLVQAGRLEEALKYAERTVAGARTCLPEHAFLVSLLFKLGRIGDAEAVLDLAASLPEGVADAYDGLAWMAAALGRHEGANELYRRATQVAPQDPRFWYNLACSERSLGRLIEAEAACDRAIALDARQYATYLLRSELRVQSPQANHIQELEAQLSGPRVEHRARVLLGYALAKELDDVGRRLRQHLALLEIQHEKVTCARKNAPNEAIQLQHLRRDGWCAAKPRWRGNY